MRAQNESNSVWFVSCLSLLVVFALFSFNVSGKAINEDIYFIYNRCYQMVDCTRHGFYPFLYYNDFAGVGYASPIFYGQLSLVPFILFLGNIHVFYKMYMLSFLLLNFFGFRCFVKRYSSYATLAACFYITSLPFVTLSLGLPAYNMAVGCSWFFLAYCVDFFRDGRSLYKVVLFYFFVWQCNFNAAALVLFACFGLFVCYFKLSRWKDYLRLFLNVFAVLLYNLFNMVSHLDALRLTDNSQIFVGDRSCMYFIFSRWPFGEWTFRFLGHDIVGDFGCGFMQFSVALLFGWLLWRDRKSIRVSVRTAVVVGLCVLGYALGLWTIWPGIYSSTKVFFQFPIRYFIFLFGLLLVLLSRHLRIEKVVLAVVLVCVFDLFLSNPFVAIANHGEPSFFSKTIGWGEYAGSSFTYDTDDFDAYCAVVNSESGESYDFVNDYNGLSVDCSSNPGVDVLTLPKLYYRWYKATGTNGKTFELSSGFSNFCQVDIGSYTGMLHIEYVPPVSLYLLLVVQVVCIARLLWYILWKEWYCVKGAKGN